MTCKAIITSLLLGTLLLNGCSAAQPQKKAESPNQFAVRRSLQMAQMMDEMAESDYAALMGMNTAELAGIIDEIAAEEYQKPASVTFVRLGEDSLKGVLRQTAPDADFSAETMTVLNRRLMSGIPNMLNGTEGVNILAAASALSYDTSYQQPADFDGNLLVILNYDRDWGVMCSFLASDEDTVLTRASFLYLSEEMQKMLKANDLGNLFGELLELEDIESTRITGDELESLLGE